MIRRSSAGPDNFLGIIECEERAHFLSIVKRNFQKNSALRSLWGLEDPEGGSSRTRRTFGRTVHELRDESKSYGPRESSAELGEIDCLDVTEISTVDCILIDI